MATALGRSLQLDVGTFRTDLPGAPIVLTESVPAARSVSVAVFVRLGAVHDPPGLAGLAHFLEHMVFKGTELRSAVELARAIEGLGGSLDAYTAREYTAYQARVLGQHVGVAIDVLADLVLHPLLRSDDVELERNVVLEEIAGVEDVPDDWVFDLYSGALWGEHPYGRPVLGRRETVRAIAREDLAALLERGYRPSRCVVAAAGQLEHEAVLEAVARFFAANDSGTAPEDVAPPDAAATPREEWVERETAQMHLCLGTRAFPHRDRRRHALEIASSALGGGMSSRLFQRVREELGLAYAIYSFHALYRRGGQVGVYAATHPSTADRMLDEVRAELARAGSEPLPAEELEAAREQWKGQQLLALESTMARAYRIAHFVLYDEPYEPLEESLGRIDAVTADQVRSVCREFLAPDRCTVVRLGSAA